MSRYALSIRSSENFEGEVQQAVQLLQQGDSLSIYIDNNVSMDSIVGVIEDENLTFKHITSGKKEYIIAKK